MCVLFFLLFFLFFSKFFFQGVFNFVIEIERKWLNLENTRERINKQLGTIKKNKNKKKQTKQRTLKLVYNCSIKTNREKERREKSYFLDTGQWDKSRKKTCVICFLVVRTNITENCQTCKSANEAPVSKMSHLTGNQLGHQLHASELTPALFHVTDVTARVV